MSLVHSVSSGLRTLARTRVGPWLARRRPTRVDLPLERWGMAIGADGHLCSDGLDLAELAARVGTPLHVVDASRLDRNATEALAPHRGGHGADMFFSYKTNPVPAVLARLHGHGIGAEVISAFELWLARELGVPPARIIYNGPAKSVASVRRAVRDGVHLINANSVHDANVIRQLAGDERVVANVGVRVAPSTVWGGQFGLAAGSGALHRTVGELRDDPWTDLRAIHVHRGATVPDETTWVAYLRDVLACCDELRRATGWQPEILDVGGSLACPTVAAPATVEHRFNRAFGSDLLPPDPDRSVTLPAASRRAADVIGEHFRALGLPVPRIVQEPGRSLTGDTQLLLTSVLDVKHDGALPHAVLDAGINIAEPVRSEYHQLFSVSSPAAPAARSYRLAGPICTPADVLYNNWRLPDLAPGDVLAIMDTGAYFVSFSTSFSFPRPAIVLRDGATTRVVRRAEEFADLIARDVDADAAADSDLLTPRASPSAAAGPAAPRDGCG